MTATTLQQLAEEARKLFVRGKRDNGTEYWHTTDGRPEWVQDMCYKAHGDMLPDDFRYAFIVDSLDAIAENEDEDDARQAAAEPDIYTHSLTAWLGSNNYRPEYCDEAAKDGLWSLDSDTGIIGLIQVGQLTEKEEVFASVLESLTERLAETAEAE